MNHVWCSAKPHRPKANWKTQSSITRPAADMRMAPSPQSRSPFPPDHPKWGPWGGCEPMAKVCSLQEGFPPSLPATGTWLCPGKALLTPVLPLGMDIACVCTIHLGTLALCHTTTVGTGNPVKDMSLMGRIRPVIPCLASWNFKSLVVKSCRAT